MGRVEEGKRKNMNQLPVRSNLVDSNYTETIIKDKPVCPKPRRVGSSVPEFLKLTKCSRHSQANSDSGRGEILSIIADKPIEGKELSSICSGCTPSCYSGSPPGRTGNPLVHDVQFTHQMELSPFTRAKISDKFGIVSATPM